MKKILYIVLALCLMASCNQSSDTPIEPKEESYQNPIKVEVEGVSESFSNESVTDNQSQPVITP